MNDKPLPNGWRVTDLPPHKVDEHLMHVQSVAEELRKIPRVKKESPRPPEGATKEELEAFYFAQQPKSTQEAMLRQKERSPDDDIAYLLRPISPDYLAVPGAVTLDELTAKRNIDPEDALREKGLKTGRNSLAQSTKGSVEGAKRDRGIEAFTYSKPANITDSEMWRIKSLNEMDAIVAAEPEAPKKEPLPSKRWWKLWNSRPLTEAEFDEYFGRNIKWWEFWK